MGSKNNEPSIRFIGFNDNWEQSKFEEIFKISQGLQIAISERYSEPGENRFFYITNEFLKSDCEGKYYIYNPSENVVCNKDDILMTRTGNTGIVVTDVEGCFHNNFFKINYDKQQFDKYFICRLLSSSMMKKRILNSAGSSTIPDLSHNSFYKLDGFFPKTEEQKKISRFFTNLDNLITLHQRKLDKLEILKKTFLNKLFPTNNNLFPGYRFKEFNDAWEQRKLGEIGKTFTSLSGKTKDDFGHGEAEFVTYMNIFSNSIANIGQTENVKIDEIQNEVKYGDIFFTTSSETPEEVGMSSVWLGNKPNVYLNSFCFGYRPMEKLDSYYMAYMLRSSEVRKKFQFLAQGISRYNISKTKVMELSVFIPKMEEQIAIGQFFNNLDNLITLHRSKCAHLKNMKKYFLNNMFI
ncbi:MAG: restriction endonuclease subunit S [Bacilli bacterium]|nr:restriction endonuclease subunit S [Bacilli bacterium]